MANVKVECWHQVDPGNFGYSSKDFGAVPCIKDERSKSVTALVTIF